MRRVTLGLVTALMAAQVLGAQTRVTAPKNKYSPQDDVKLGREAAQQVEQELPLLRDDNVASYVEQIGERLERHIPRDLDHPDFRYTFKVVNLKEINAFALPGGPMYVNRGMMEAAASEGEIAGVMAHELSHVALRHGTAQATKAQPYALGQIAGAVVGAIVGGTAGSIISQGTQFGLGTAFLRYSREYEKQADLLGAQIMARAGYDPREMANMFRTIERQGRSGPQFLSDHPNPGNRSEYITREAESLRVEQRVRDTRDFQEVKSRLARMSPAPSAEEISRGSARRGNTGGNDGGARPVAARVESPSGQYTTYNEGDLFRISVPSNWRELGGNNSVTFAPEGAYGTISGQSVFTHGAQVGVARSGARDLRSATDELIGSLAQANPRLGRPSGYSRVKVGGNEGLRTTLSNVSDATGAQEQIAVYTTQVRDGALFYMIGVAPTADYRQYDGVFRKIVGSVRFSR